MRDTGKGIMELKAGIKPGWVSVPVRGQNFLSKYGFSTSKLEVVDQVTVEGSQVDIELEGFNENISPTTKSPYNEAGKSSNKRLKLDVDVNENRIEVKVDNLTKDLVTVKAMLEKIEQKMPIEKDPADQHIGDDDVDFENVIDKCRNISEFDEKLSTLDIIKEKSEEDHIDVYFCSICFDGTKPTTKNLLNQKPGARVFDRSKDDTTDKLLSRELRNLKTMVKAHLKTKTHLQKQKILKTQTLNMKKRSSRIRMIGLNVFRTRYNGILQARSRIDFETDILKGKMNGEDLGDINHSRRFAKDLDDAIYETMKADIKHNVNKKLSATNQKRPFGLVFDKMTPNKTTGQIHGVIVPVPENPLTQDFLVPLMLDIPTVKDHSAAGLAVSAKEIFNSFGFSDDMLEGIGVDGEYIKKGVKTKLLELLDIEGWTELDKDRWITAVWEPAHQLELTTKDVRKLDAFDWLEKQIQIINDVASILNIGKGLEESKVAAEEVNAKFYKLRTLSDTRFAAYFESSIDNFVKRTETTITALRKREQSNDKKVKESASRLLKNICSKTFLILNLGLLDIYRLLGSISSLLQSVQQFPWDIPKKQSLLIKTLKKMENLKLDIDEGTGELEEIDESLWPSLGESIDSVLDGTYLTIHTVLEINPRRTRSQADISMSKSLLITVQNRLSSLCKHLASILSNRLKDSPTPSIISTMGGCFDLEMKIHNLEMIANQNP